MSYSFGIPSGSVADFEAAAKAAADAYQANLAAQDYALDPAAQEAIAVGLAAAKAIVDSGAVGTGLVQGTIGGHANPGHKPVKGWANDSLTVTVYSADPAPSA